MPIRKRRKNKLRGRKDKKNSELKFFKHPLSDIPKETLIKGLADVGRRHAEQFPALLQEMQETINGVDALQGIATLSTYGMMGGITDTGERKPYLQGERFNQSHVELIQALALCISENERALNPSLPDVIQRLLDGLPELADAFNQRRLIQVEVNRTQDEKAVLFLQEHLRSHTQIVRNWGYFHRVLRIIRDLIAPIDTSFRYEIGVPATTLISLFELLIAKKEKTETERMVRLSEVIRQPTVESAIYAYYKVHPAMKESAERMIELAQEQNYSLEAIRSIFLSHSELSLSGEAIFHIDEVAKQLDVDPEGLGKALNMLSLSFGDLAEENVEHFFLNNPVWTRPVIKISKTDYFCAIPSTFFSFIFPIFEQLLEGKTKALENYYKRRSEFLEEEVEKLFRRSFPESECVVNYRWKNAEEEFENDVIVLIDSHLILIEAKSGAVSWPALRGASGRAKTHAQQLLLAPSEQSLNFQRRIEEVIKKPHLRNELLPNLNLDISQVRKILRLSVTLEDFAILQSNLHLVRDAGWIPRDHPLAMSILFSDLEIVFDILELTPLKLHYLQRRAHLEAHASYMGDEMDLLGFYLKTGFNIGAAEVKGPHLVLSMLSKPVDRYYMGVDDDVRVQKPRLRLTQWWLDLCNTLEKRKFFQWSEMAVVLLNFSFEEQQKIEKSFKKIRKNVLKKWREDNHLSAITVIPEAYRSDALAIYAFRERHSDERKEKMRNIAGQVFVNLHVKRCMIIGINIDRNSYPYSTLAVFFPGEATGNTVDVEQSS